jgi:hypothetical protein
MKKWTLFVGVVCAAGMLAACERASAPTAPDGMSGSTAVLPPQAVRQGASGGGRYLLIDALDAQFSFSANQHGDGRASGQFHQTVEFQGQHVEFHGTVTCLTVDTAAGRAWIGGVITQNKSAHPAFQAARNEPGRDIWFRVLDNGQGSAAAADRTTFVGFEGDAGFATSADYCAGQPWPDDDARTWAVTEGNIDVRP